ncbi:Hypothetical predicted protein, partial [Marmota monax]
PPQLCPLVGKHGDPRRGRGAVLHHCTPGGGIQVSLCHESLKKIHLKKEEEEEQRVELISGGGLRCLHFKEEGQTAGSYRRQEKKGSFRWRPGGQWGDNVVTSPPG